MWDPPEELALEEVAYMEHMACGEGQGCEAGCEAFYKRIEMGLLGRGTNLGFPLLLAKNLVKNLVKTLVKRLVDGTVVLVTVIVESIHLTVEVFLVLVTSLILFVLFVGVFSSRDVSSSDEPECTHEHTVFVY
jgi:hypothetical protein